MRGAALGVGLAGIAAGVALLVLTVDATNPTGAVRAYEKVGMTVHRTVAAYEKALG